MSKQPNHDLYRSILEQAQRRLDVPVREAELLRVHSNAIFVARRANLLIRIATNPDALQAVSASLKVTRWLRSRGFACVEPAPVPGQPLVISDHVVSLWRYLTIADPPADPGAQLGRLLAELHGQPEPPAPPPALLDPLASVARAVHRHTGALPQRDHAWLIERITDLRQRWTDLTFPHPSTLIHGDAHPNNLMRQTSGQVVLGDWDHVAMGPREWDLIQIHYTRRRFGRPSDADLDAFTTAYGWDVNRWPGAADLIAVRELTGLSPYLRQSAAHPPARAELLHRLRTLQDHDIQAAWHPPSEL